MPSGKRCGSTTILALASRLTCQQSSMLTYAYPASFIPDFTTASAIPLIRSSLTLQANLFHEFHPMGGVRARLAEGEVLACPKRLALQEVATTIAARISGRIFMLTFYQKWMEIGRDCMRRWVSENRRHNRAHGCARDSFVHR